MKILVITQYFWPENFRINDLVMSLAQRGHEVIVLTGKPNYPKGHFFEGYGFFGKFNDYYQGIRIIRSPVIPRRSGKPHNLFVNYLSFSLFALLSSVVILKKKIDIAFVYEPSPITVAIPAIFLKKIKSTPVVMWVQDLWPESITATGAIKSKCVLRFIGYLVSYIYNRCDILLVQSKAFIPSIKHYTQDDGHIIYFPNYAEDIYMSSNVKTHDDASPELPEGFRVLFAGNIGAAQDFDTILSAAEAAYQLNPSIHWVIVGDGRKKEWLTNEVKKRSLNKIVHVMGSFSINEMPFFYQNCDVMLVTLRKEKIFSYTIPGKVQSYMAAGKPIVGCLDGEGKRVIEEATAGIIADAGNAEQLALNVYYFSMLPKNQLVSYGKNAFDYYNENFNKVRLMDYLESNLLELIKK